MLGVVRGISTDVINAYEALAGEPEKCFTNLDVKRRLFKCMFHHFGRDMYMDLLRVELWALVKTRDSCHSTFLVSLIGYLNLLPEGLY
jgi:hypothetical protein